jgi:hypothetical protein
MEPISGYKLPGTMVRQLMRKNGVTIRSVARNFNVSMKRVREVRAVGVSGFAANEWHYMITGFWLDKLAAQSAVHPKGTS